MARSKKPPDISKIKKYQEYLTSYKCVKTSLKAIIKDESDIARINKIVCTMNKIVIHSYQFLKMYCVKEFFESNSLPEINQKLIVLIMKTLCEADSRGRDFSKETQKIKNQLELFYEDYYEPLTLERYKLIYTNLVQSLEYEATSIITCLSNHIQEHFDHMLNRYINIVFDKKELESKCNDKSDVYKIRNQLAQLKRDLLYSESKSDPKYSNFIGTFKKLILKDVKVNKTLAYTAQSKPLDLLIALIRMSVDGEKIMIKRNSKSGDTNLFNVINCFPLRKTIRPKYIDLDTNMIILNLMTSKKGYYMTNGNMLKLSDEIWDMFFKTNNKAFIKNGYTFNRRISTDGVGCSILLVRNDLYDPLKKVTVRQIKKPKGYTDDVYVNELTEDDKIECSKRMLVGVDPGKNDLIHCSNGVVNLVNKSNGKIYRKAEHYKFSQKLRREQIKTDIYLKKIENDKKKTRIKGKTVKRIEDQLSKINSASCLWTNVYNYVKTKNQVNNLLLTYYEKEMYRKLNWYNFINKQKSDADIVNRFKKKFGGPDQTVLLFGDFEQRKQMKYKQPSKGRSLRKLFRNHEYKVYLVDEFRTSCRLYEDGEELVNVRNCHSLLGSKILHNRLGINKNNKPDPFMKDMIKAGYRPTIINRDLNGSLNIRLKGLHLILGLPEPEYMTRQIKEPIKPKLLVKGKTATTKRKVVKRALIKTN